MGGYKTVVVGTDGSDSSLRAVDRAGYLASEPGSKVVVATAYFPANEDTRAADLLKDEGYKMAGNAPSTPSCARHATVQRRQAPPKSKSALSSAPRLTPWWSWPKRSAPIS